MSNTGAAKETGTTPNASSGSGQSDQSKESKEVRVVIISPEALDEEITEIELKAAAQMLKREVSDISYYASANDAQDRPIYLWVEFSQGGYMIILRTHGVPMEYSYTSQGGPFSRLHDKQKYYFGMFSYGYGENGQIISAAKGEVLSQETLESAVQITDMLLQRITDDFAERYRLFEKSGKRVRGSKSTEQISSYSLRPVWWCEQQFLKLNSACK